MEITMKNQQPDGINIKIENIIVDTRKEAHQLIEAIDKELDKINNLDIVDEVLDQ